MCEQVYQYCVVFVYVFSVFFAKCPTSICLYEENVSAMSKSCVYLLELFVKTGYLSL